MAVQPALFQQRRCLKFQNCKSGFVVKLCLFQSTGVSTAVGSPSGMGMELWRMFLPRSWNTILPPPTQCRICAFLSLILPFSPFSPSSRTLIDGNTCWELSLTFFPDTESMKCYAGAMSIFESKAVNVKPVLIYWDEL